MLTRANSARIPAPYMKPFDLEAGDVVKCPDMDDDVRPTKGKARYRWWTVESVSKYVFTCRNALGIRASFRKDEYRLGWITKDDKKSVDV